MSRGDIQLKNVIFMWPKIDAPYVYFDKLFIGKRIDDGEALLPYKRTVANSIGAYARGVMRTDRDEYEKYGEQMFNIEKTINFLRILASNERAKEIRLIDFCLDVVKKDYITDAFKQEFRDLKQNLNSNKIDYDQYIHFIDMLNESLQDMETYKKRLNAIIEKTAFFSNNNRALEHHMASQASTILNTLTSRRTRFGTSQEGIITMLTLKFFQDGPGAEFLKNLTKAQLSKAEFGRRFTVATVIVEQELARYLHDNKKMQAYTQEEMGKEEFQRVYNELLDVVTENVFQTKKWNDIFSNTTLNEEISSIFRITKLSSKLSARKTKKENDPNQAAREMMDSLGLTDILKNKLVTDSAAYIKVTPQFGAVALYAELTSLINSNIKTHGTRIGGQGAAIDLVRIAVSPSNTSDLTTNMINQFLKKLKQFKFNTDEDDKNAKELTQNFLAELNTLENDLRTVKDIFILHETTKLYRSIEGGKGFRGRFAKGFKGRNINLITYINDLIQIGESIGVEPNWLKFLAYNTASGAINSNDNKTYLESILAVAGGLIMFDDFGVMAKELKDSSEIASRKVNNIHLYKLNEVYCPASFFLQMTADMLEEGLSYVSSENNSFSVEITPAEVEYTEPIADQKHQIKSSTWTKYKTQARRANIQLYFAANFIALVTQLLRPQN